MFEAVLAACVLDQDAAHGFGRSGEEGITAIPVLTAPLADQAQISFVDERGGIERLPRRFVGQPAQPLVDER
jgi:hypothetical protein